MFDINIIADHWFWWLTTAACVVWYSTVTVYVAVRGVADIKSMLKRLGAGHGGTADAPGR
ncbi:MAG: hypothetical protein FJ288_15380 [Planctomycetes bacterium]|nr:hypothetical protein [Planctomycetota bacterium]